MRQNSSSHLNSWLRSGSGAITLLFWILSPLLAQDSQPCAAPGADRFAVAWLDAFNAADVDRILTFYNHDAVYEDVPSLDNGWDALLDGREMIKAALVSGFEEFPDQNFELVSASCAGDRLVVEWIMTGTNLGDFPGMTATGRSISIRGVSLVQLEKGKIAKQRDYYDGYLLLSQLGIVPSTGPEDE
jgi:steroid delta-isomerase-like uncharacterized protein